MKILISGSGIAGPALAFWLTKLGAHVTIVEQASALRTGGYAIDVRGAALDVLNWMGLRDAVRPFETDTLCNEFIDERGRRFGKTERGFGVLDEGDVEIHRGDLSRILYEATRNDAAYRFGESIVELVPSGLRVGVALASGQSDEYDLVVGADGVHSRTRELAFPEERPLIPLGLSMAVFTIPNFLGLYREQIMFNAPRRVASVKSANGNRELKVCAFFASENETKEGASVAPVYEIADQRRLVSCAFADAGWEFPRLLAAMQEAEDFYCDVTCQIRMKRHYRGSVALVGDAGYCPSPLSGQGTSLALIGAYVLASALADSSSDVPLALALYDGMMKDFVQQNQKIALKIARNFIPETPFAAWSRNIAMRMLPYLPGSGLLIKRAMTGVRDAARAISLPETVRKLAR